MRRPALFLVVRLLFRRRQAFEAPQQFFFGHALDGHFHVVGIGAGASGPDQRHHIGLRLVDFNVALQGMDQLFAQVREMVSSAISRRATTGFLSLSRSIVKRRDPDEIMRARRASRIRSKRLSTLSIHQR